MFRNMKQFMLILPRLIFETLSPLMFFLIVKALFDHYHIGYIAVIAIGIMLVSYVLNKRIKSRQSLIFGLITAIVFGMFLNQFTISMKIIYSLFYFYIWIAGLKMNVNYEYPSIYMRKFYIHSLIMIALMITIGLGNIAYYVNELSVYFIIYAMAVMLYVGKLNIEDIYSDREANDIKGKKNKYKGIVLNILIIFLIIFMIANVLISNAELFKNFFEMALKPVGLIGERFSKFIESKIIDRSGDGIGDGSLAGVAEEASEVYEYRDNIERESRINFKLIFQILVFSGSFILLLLYSLKLFKRDRIIEIEEEDYTEVRESVFSKELLLSKTMKGIYNVVNRFFPKKNKSERLSPIRQKYKETIGELLQAGRYITISDTPDDILKKSLLNGEERKKMYELTNIYKKIRYSDEIVQNEEALKVIDANIVIHKPV